jgi:hypothetical protein
MKKRANAKAPHRRKRVPRDPETTLQRGMSGEGADVDAAETMASTGDAAGSFSEVASGTATGFGVDRGEAVGTGGLAAGEDRDEVAGGDWWRENFRRRSYFPPEESAERFGEDEPTGWQKAADLEDDDDPGRDPEKE